MGVTLQEFLPEDAVDHATSILEVSRQKAIEEDLQTLAPTEAEFLRRSAIRNYEAYDWKLETMRLGAWQSFHLALTSFDAWTRVRDELSRVRAMLLGDSAIVRNSTGALCTRLEAAADSCCSSLIETIKFKQSEGDSLVGLVAVWRASSEELLSRLLETIRTQGLSGSDDDLGIFDRCTNELESLLDSKLYRIVVHVKEEITALLNAGDHHRACGIANACDGILKEVMENCIVVNAAVEFLVDSYITVNLETAEVLTEILLPRVRPDSPIKAADFDEGSVEFIDRERILPWAKAAVNAAELVACEKWQLDSVLLPNQLKRILGKIHRGIMLTVLLSSELEFD